MIRTLTWEKPPASISLNDAYCALHYLQGPDLMAARFPCLGTNLQHCFRANIFWLCHIGDEADNETHEIEDQINDEVD